MGAAETDFTLQGIGEKVSDRVSREAYRFSISTSQEAGAAQSERQGRAGLAQDPPKQDKYCSHMKPSFS